VHFPSPENAIRRLENALQSRPRGSIVRCSLYNVRAFRCTVFSIEIRVGIAPRFILGGTDDFRDSPFFRLVCFRSIEIQPLPVHVQTFSPVVNVRLIPLDANKNAKTRSRQLRARAHLSRSARIRPRSLIASKHRRHRRVCADVRNGRGVKTKRSLLFFASATPHTLAFSARPIKDTHVSLIVVVFYNGFRLPAAATRFACCTLFLRSPTTTTYGRRLGLRTSFDDDAILLLSRLVGDASRVRRPYTRTHAFDRKLSPKPYTVLPFDDVSDTDKVSTEFIRHVSAKSSRAQYMLRVVFGGIFRE